MPEIHVKVPSLQIPSENASEIENSSSAAETSERSTNCHEISEVEASETRRATKTLNKSKMRKSHGKRLQKKAQLRPLNCEKKVTSALQPRSQIPIALGLTPTTATSSVNCDDFSPSVSKRHIEEEHLESFNSKVSCLARQKSALISAFRQRKSFSQMDFHHSRRQVNFTIPSPPPNIQGMEKCENKTLQLGKRESMTVVHPNGSFVHNMYNQDYYFTLHGRDPQVAGMKIFAAIMLNAWRKRRDEVRRLMAEVADLKRAATKTKNQLHVFNSLFRVEQKRNDELNFQLKRSLDSINLTKSSCDSLTTSLISLKADKALLEQQLQVKEKELESINSLLTQTKSELFKSMTIQREIQALLSAEQRRSQTLETQKNELINEICELNNDALQKEVLCREIKSKDVQLADLKQKLSAAERKIKILNQSAEQQLSENKAREERMRQEIESMENKLKNVHKCLEETIGHRLKSCWNNSMVYQRITLQVLHVLAYYVLPAMPPPKIKTLPLTLSLDKVLSVVKR